MPAQSSPIKVQPRANHIPIPASQFDFEQLAAIYNESRIDYIVPMPMNAPRMREYVFHHDIDLDTSVVALNLEGEPVGIGMLGLRDLRGWITRLGVMPNQRGKKCGEFIMNTLLQTAYGRGVELVQLEVIEGNEPAHRLFLKLGFQPTRDLLIIRRPPGQPSAELPVPSAVVTPFSPDDILYHLQHRPPDASWIEETPSLVKAGKLKGFSVELESGQRGWIIFQATLFQLAHFVMNAPDDDITYALLYHLHQQYPVQDTKVENVSADTVPWRIFQTIGYVEAFRRVEMVLALG